MLDRAALLAATEAIDCDHPDIRARAARICDGARDDEEKARRLFTYARDEVAYSPFNPFHLPEFYRATAILERGRGYCVQKAVVLAALARAASIPAALVFVDIRNHLAPRYLTDVLGSDLFVYHSYVELHVGDRRPGVTPAFDKRICDKHGFPVVDFDGRNDAFFPPETPDGRRFVEYEGRHGTFADVPLPEILAAWEAEYGADRVALWIAAMERGAAYFS